MIDSHSGDYLTDGRSIDTSAYQSTYLTYILQIRDQTTVLSICRLSIAGNLEPLPVQCDFEEHRSLLRYDFCASTMLERGDSEPIVGLAAQETARRARDVLFRPGTFGESEFTMSTSRRLIGSFVVIILVAVSLAGAWWRINSAGGSDREGVEIDSGDRPELSATSAFSTDVAIPVSGRTAVMDTLVISVSAAAQAAAERLAPLSARVAGRVIRVHVHENQTVEAGALLVEIDSAEYRLNVADAAARLAQAEATYRETTLFDDEIEDPEVRAERDRVARAKSGFDQAQVNLEMRQLELARTKVRAPFAGRVASVGIVEGQEANVGDRLLTVIDLDPIKVEVQVLESEVGYLVPGRKATILFSAFPNETFTGTVETINPVVEQSTRTARVTVRVPNPDGRILPGMYARVSIEAREFPDRLMVPRSAILERDRRNMLFVFEGEGDEGLAKWRYVTTGLMNDSLVEVIANPETELIEPGEIVLTDGHYTLIHDARVRLVGNVRAAGGRPQ